MSDSAVARFVREAVVEPDHIARARQDAIELGAAPVSPVVGSQIAAVAAASGARSIIEIGQETDAPDFGRPHRAS